MRFVQLLFLIGVVLAGAAETAAQERVDVGGTAYIDYFYRLVAPDAIEGVHGFTYRRLYLTADVTFNEAFSGRARFEANASSSGPRGPVPFVKDLYVRWKGPGGHRVSLGVMPPPAFETAERVWGYRSLEATVLDLFDVVDSRDFGLRVDGPVGGERLRYAVMLANNDAVRPETDAFKRLYGELLATPTDALVFTLGGDYAGLPDGLERAYRLTAFGGYRTEVFSAGLESFLYREGPSGEETNAVGASVFARFAVAEGWELVGRVDRVRTVDRDVAREPQEQTTMGTFALVGVSFTPTKGVRLIPNLHYLDEGDGVLSGRFTVELRF